MLQNFQEVLAWAKRPGQMAISVAAAQDKDVLQALKLALDNGLARPLLVGDAAAIRPLMAEVGLPADTPVFDEKDMTKAALTAVSLVRKGEAQVVMKGLINTSDFLKAVLNQEVGLRTGRLLSHLAVFEVPGEPKLIFHSDGGMNIAPSLAEKKDILVNAMLAMRALGIEHPNVAVLTANEQVNPRMPATTDAQALVAMAATGELPPGIVEGPIAFDVAVNPEAARHKGLTSRVSGQVDLFLMPNIETGNALGKATLYYGKAKMAGIVLGATNPIVLTSRSETAEGKLYSIALACLAAGGAERR
ncbi:MAG TPA: bifunctional enoyl-CoA hydratase/phosphate acetyltransferase [Negativicutes bacterium]|nr:bifunctional enoyl-CoA hydratase/phosphate acetyltransferase [Negativicutes bacterium]